MNQDCSVRDNRSERWLSDSSTQSQQTVLYVDGDSKRRRRDAEALEEAIEEVSVRGIETESEALDLLFDIDCLVSRYDLPDTDGIQLAERVRAHSCDIPFLLVTDKGSEQLASEATAVGVSEYVPVDGSGTGTNRVAARVKKALAESRQCIATNQLDGIEASVENAADAILITDTDGTIKYVNPAFESVTGYSRGEVIGNNPRILKSGEQGEAYYEEMWSRILDGEVWEEEIINETKSGERYVAHQTIAPVTDADGTVKQFVGIQRDVTRRRMLEEQIERSATTLEELYRIAADQAVDLEAKIQSVLELGTNYLEYPLGYVTRIDDETQHIIAAVGDHDAIQPGASDPIERTYCRKTIANEEPVVVSDAPEEGWESDPAFEHFGLRCYVGARIIVDGEMYGTLCFAGEKKREQLLLEAQRSTVKTLARWLGYELERHEYESRLERQNTQLEQFASVVSHDLRNPLNVAQARLNLGRETGDSEHFEQVADAHDRMAEIIDDTLVLAREGTFVEETEPVSLDSLATECWGAVDTATATLTITAETTVDADSGKLRHVFENLFRNAVEHAGDDVTVEVGPTEEGFYVSDDGPGIDEENRETVFEHGYSGTDGTGFGLAIVKAIADAHGWSCVLTESRSGGARFEFVTEDAVDPREELLHKV